MRYLRNSRQYAKNYGRGQRLTLDAGEPSIALTWLYLIFNKRNFFDSRVEMTGKVILQTKASKESMTTVRNEGRSLNLIRVMLSSTWQQSTVSKNCGADYRVTRVQMNSSRLTEDWQLMRPCFQLSRRMDPNTANQALDGNNRSLSVAKEV